MTNHNNSFQQIMEQGHSAAWDQKWDQAVEFYRQALEISSNHKGAVTSLGLALFELQDYQEALRYYLLAARLSPKDPLPFEKIAQIYAEQGSTDHCIKAALQAAELYLKNHDVNKAIENWERILALRPDHLQAHSRLALVYQRMGKEKAAVLEFLNIASIFQQSSEVEKAFQTLNHAIQVFPGNDSLRQALDLLKQGRLLPKPVHPSGHAAPQQGIQESQPNLRPFAVAQEGSLDPIAEARQNALTVLAGMLFEAPEEEPQEPASRRGLQSFVLGLGDRFPKQADPARIYQHLGQLVNLQTQGEIDQAAKELERAVEAGLNHEAAYYDLGYLYTEVGRPDSALQSLQQALNHPEYSLGGHLLLGQVFSSMARWNEAAVEYLEALCLADAAVAPLDQAEDLRQMYEPMIEAQKQVNDPDAQKRLCENIRDILLQPAWRERLRYARQQLPMHETGGPPVPFAEILTQARSSQVVELLNRVNGLSAAGFLHSAMEEAFYALQFAPTYLPLHAYMGDLLIRQNRLPEAVGKLLIVARTYSIRGETRRAIDIYQRVIELAPMDEEVYRLLIEQLTAVGRLDDAIQVYLDLAEASYHLADLDMVRKVLGEAYQLAQEARVARSWRVKILYRTADLDLQRLDLRQALRDFEQIRILQPDDDTARLKLAELHFRLGQESLALSEIDNFVAYLGINGQKEKAAGFLENMLQENMGSPSVHRRLAEIYAQMGRTRDAVAQYDKAGEGYLQAGDRAGAVGAIEAILKLNPQNAGEYQKLLGKIRGSEAAQ